MTHARGTNQYGVKGRFTLLEKVLLVILINGCAGIVLHNTQKEPVSPIPDIRVETVYAKETPTYQSIKEKLAVACIRNFGEQHIDSLMKLVFKESSFNQFAVNKNGGACGLFQAYPCQKMKCSLNDADCQIEWGMKYIKSRYGNPNNAWSFWQEHKWY